jgi:hypothetical protein
VGVILVRVEVTLCSHWLVVASNFGSGLACLTSVPGIGPADHATPGRPAYPCCRRCPQPVAGAPVDPARLVEPAPTATAAAAQPRPPLPVGGVRAKRKSAGKRRGEWDNATKSAVCWRMPARPVTEVQVLYLREPLPVVSSQRPCPSLLTCQRTNHRLVFPSLICPAGTNRCDALERHPVPPVAASCTSSLVRTRLGIGHWKQLAGLGARAARSSKQKCHRRLQRHGSAER